jgi:Ca-activated chloride channel family protein
MSALGPWRFSLLGYQAGFAQPLLLALLLVGVLVGVLGVRAAFRRRERVAALLTERLAEKLAPGVSVARPAAQSVLYGLGLMLLSLALAQPQCGSRTERIKRQGIDLVVALDASKSMLARDVQPSRISRAKLELSTLLDELKGDRVGIVAFAGEAFIQSPLTHDYSAAKMFLRAVEPEEMPQGGTNIADALRLAHRMLTSTDRGAKDRVVVLLSDGEDLMGGVDAAVAELKEAGIKVLAVGIGSPEGEPIPLFNRRGDFVDYLKDASGRTVITRLDQAGLTSIAERTGGASYYQPRGVAMGEVVARIDKMQKAELESRISVRYEERFQAFLLPGLLLLLVGMALVPRAQRRPS